MKTLLLVYLSFSIEGGATSTQTMFESNERCETAKRAVISNFLAEKEFLRKRQIVAVCV